MYLYEGFKQDIRCITGDAYFTICCVFYNSTQGGVTNKEIEFVNKQISLGFYKKPIGVNNDMRRL